MIAIIVSLVLTAIMLFPMNVMAEREETSALGMADVKFKA